DCPHDDQHQSHYRRRVLPSTGSQKELPDDGQTENAEHPPNEAHVQAHITVEKMAELVRDDSLQFIAREKFHATARHADDRITGRVSGGKCIDSFLVLQDVDLRNWYSRGNRHFLDDIQQLSLVGIVCVRVEQLAAQSRCEGGAALRDFADFVEAADDDDQQSAGADGGKQFRIPQSVEVVGWYMARTEEDCCQQNVNDPDHRRHGRGEIENQPPGFPSGMRLLFDKIHWHNCILIARTERYWKLQIIDAHATTTLQTLPVTLSCRDRQKQMVASDNPDCPQWPATIPLRAGEFAHRQRR